MSIESSRLKIVLVDRLYEDGLAEVFSAHLTTEDGTFLVTVRRLKESILRLPPVMEVLRKASAIQLPILHENLTQHLGLMGDDLQYWVNARWNGIDLETIVTRLGEKGTHIDSTAGLQIACDVLAGLGSLHLRERVHGALEPRQVLVCSDGVSRLDAGGFYTALMKFEALQHDSRRGREFYLAPEVARGKRPTLSSDVFSAAAILYSLLTGFSPVELIRKRSAWSHGSIPRPSQANPGLPFACDAVLMKALSASPGNRHREAEALHRAVKRLQAAMGTLQEDGRRAVRKLVTDQTRDGG